MAARTQGFDQKTPGGVPRFFSLLYAGKCLVTVRRLSVNEKRVCARSPLADATLSQGSRHFNFASVEERAEGCRFRSMILYLIRHAHALRAEEDPERPLSKRGRGQVRALAAFLRPSAAFEARELWHSPLARSQETAELLRGRLKLDAALKRVAGLEGDDDPRVIARKLATPPAESLAIVGHEPHLGALATLLVTGAAEPVRFIFKKAAVLALERVEDHWAVRWQIAPEIIP